MNRSLLAILASMSLAQPVFAQVQSNTLANDLNPTDNALITQDQINQINASIAKLQNATEQTVTPDVVGAPDYKIARVKLQFAIGDAIANYLQSMDQINTQVIQTLQKLASLSAQTSSLSDQLMQNEMNRLIPSTNASINQIYKSALEHLYLTDYYILNVTRAHVKHYGRRWLNPLKEFESSKSGTYSNDYCVTGACQLQLAQDLSSWFSFVGTLNQSISILNYKTNVTPSNQSMSPFVTEAFLSAFQELTRGPKPNISYNLGGYMTQLLKIPAGYVSEISLVPTFIFEKTAKLASKIWNTQFTKLQLALNSIDAYSIDEITQAVNRQQQDMASQVPAVLYGNAVQKYLDEHSDKTLSVGKTYQMLNGSLYHILGDHHACLTTPNQLDQWNNDAPPLLEINRLDSSYTVDASCPYAGTVQLKDGRVIFFIDGISYCHIQKDDLGKFPENITSFPSYETDAYALAGLNYTGDCWKGNYRTPDLAMNHILDSGHYCHIAPNDDRFAGTYTHVPSMQNLVSVGDCQ